MEWQDRYLCPLVEREKISLKKIERIIKDFFILLLHAVSFHQQSKEPPEQLPEFVSEDIDTIYEVCKELYYNATGRIDKIEEKSLKLLTYVSALFAIISFVFINSPYVVAKLILMIAMALLVLSIIISFRCVSVKGRKSFFISDIYNFDNEMAEENFDKKSIAKNLMNSAIYNQNVADNTTDILRAARSVIVLALILCIIGFIFGMDGYFKQASIAKADRQIELKHLDEKLEITNELLRQTNLKLSNIEKNQELKREIGKIEKQVESMMNDYNSLVLKEKQKK